MDHGRRPSPARLTAAIAAGVALLALRLAYGLSMPFWSEDERQVYLIGLRSFARGTWPSFGADVVWSGGQLPGALQALLIKWPLELWPIPEAPFVLLNLLSFAALAFFAWYLTRRFPDVPRWLIWAWLLTCPWTINFSTHIINTSYVLPGAIVFFVGFFEGAPAFRRGIVPLAVAWAAMGFGLMWVLQIHMSWVVLPVYVVAAAIATLKPVAGAGFSKPRRGSGSARRMAAVGFLAGAVPLGILVWPTFASHGLTALGLGGVTTFQWQSPVGLITTAGRALSFSSFELLRFLGLTRAERILVIWREPWIAPFVAVVLLAGVAQPIWMAVMAFRRGRVSIVENSGESAGAPGLQARGYPGPEGPGLQWHYVRILVAATIGLIYISYFFSIRGQQAHAFYVVFPISAFFAVSCWDLAARSAGGPLRWAERAAVLVLISNLIVHAGLAIDRRPRASLYADRTLVTAAIADRNDRYLGDRRDTQFATEDHRPRPIDQIADADAYLAASPTADLHVRQVVWRPARDLASSLSVTIEHTGQLAAWLDVRYVSTYLDGAGHVIETHEGVIKSFIEPGDTRTWDVADGNVPSGAVTVTVALTSAERAIAKK